MKHELAQKHYVVMLDLAFLGIYLLAEDEEQAKELALAALDNLHTEREPIGILGTEYGLS